MKWNVAKRFVCLALTLVLLLCNFPMAAIAAEPQVWDDSENAVNSDAYGEGTIYPEMNEVEKSIDAQVRNYAKSLNFSGADNAAALALAMHGITGRGKHLKMGEDHALTATLMNSEMGLSTLIRGCIMVITTMQHNDMSSAANNAGCNYDAVLPFYYTDVYPNDSFNRDECLYSGNVSIFSGSFNAYDKSLMWMSGSTEIHMYFVRETVTADNVTYNVTVKFTDRFDFNSDSSSVPEEFASLIGSFLFRSFNWTATTEFQVTVPNPCTHQSGNYHMIYDAGEQQIVAETSGAFDENGTRKLQFHYLHTPEGTYRTYYQLNRAIHLRHDRPWVMEYTKTDSDALSLAQVNIQSSARPYFYHASEMRYLFIPVMKRLSDETAQTDYYGVPLEDKFQYQDGDSYRIRLENVPENGGKNTIYLTIFNETTQETVLQSTPMNACYSLQKKEYVLKEADSDGLNGMDFVISYIGDTSLSFESASFEMKVWENGEAGAAASCSKAVKVTAPTCTEQGYTTYTCSACGHSYNADYTPAKGHSYGEWTLAESATCTDAGEEIRSCTDCGHSESREIAPVGHNYESVVSEPTCQQGGYTTYTCLGCGDSYTEAYTDPVDHSYEDGACIWCGAEETLVKWYSGTTSLNGTIDLNIYVLLSENLVNADDTYVRFTYAEKTVDVPMADALHSPNEGNPNRYRFSCPIYAKQLADSVNVKFMKGEEMLGEELNYSVKQYCENQIRKSPDEKLVALCKALLNYGAAAQQLLNYNTENLANASLSDADKILRDVDASDYKYSVTGSENGITARSATLMLEDVVKVRVYFTLTGNKPIEAYTFTIDGKAVTPSHNEKGWYVETDGIAGKDLEKMFKIQVGGITVNYGALSFVNSKVGGSNVLESNVSKALFAYWQAAEELLG